jgi:hypothetical protein
MAKIVKEIMNSELLSIRADDLAERALGYVLSFDVTAAPVVDEEGRPIGVASLRDLVSREPPITVAECMTTPAATIEEAASIDSAACRLAEQGLHRLIVVAPDGRATGVVSAMDVVSGLIGYPVRHPAPFPHYDKQLDIFWTDDMPLDRCPIDEVPNGPGVLALVSGGQHRTERLVWAEAVNSLPSRLADLTARPQTENKDLERLLEREKDLRVRAAHVPSPARREAVVRAIMHEVRSAWAPHDLRAPTE